MGVRGRVSEQRVSYGVAADAGDGGVSGKGGAGADERAEGSWEVGGRRGEFVGVFGGDGGVGD